MFKKVLKNTTAQIIGKGITATITMLVTILISRNLGPAGYGDFTKIAVFVGYFYTLSDFGLNTIYIKIATEEKLEHLRPLFGLRILIGISLAITAIAIAQLFPYNPDTQTGFGPIVKIGILIASTTIITQALFTTANAFFQKILRYDLSVSAAVSSYVVIVAGVLFVTQTTKSILGYTAAYSIGGVFLFIFAYLLIARRTKKLFYPTFSKEEFLTFLKPAWPVGVALIFNLIYFRIDVLILSNFRPSSEVGIYGLAYQFFETATAVPIFFANSIYPVVQKAYTQNSQNFKDQIRLWFKILLGASFVVTIGLIAASLFIPFIFGHGFAPSQRSLQVLALGMPFFFISALLWHLIIVFNKQKYLTAIYAFGAMFNIGTNLIFIPKYGYMAASAITVVSEALITLLLVLTIKFKSKQ